MMPITKTIRRTLLAALLLAFGASISNSYAQSTDNKPADQKAGTNEKREPPKVDEIAEVGRQLSGPASNPECYWLGRRLLNRLWADDLDTAFRHLDLYDRFGCPGGHIQATFRCMVRQSDTKDTKDKDAKDAKPVSLDSRIFACWINPSMQPSAPASTAAQSPEGGTTTR